MKIQPHKPAWISQGVFLQDFVRPARPENSDEQVHQHIKRCILGFGNFGNFQEVKAYKQSDWTTSALQHLTYCSRIKKNLNVLKVLNK